MPDMIDFLRTLPHDTTSAPAGADVVAADVARGHQALIRRRRRRIAGSSAFVAVAAAVAVGASGQLTRPGGATRPVAKGPGVTKQASPMRLVAYTGAQPVGFKVRTVPAGWHVVSSDRSAFVVAPPGADTAPGGAATTSPRGRRPASVSKTGAADGKGVSFEGRIVVMLQGMSRLPGHSPVTKVVINGEQGRLGFADGGDAKTRAKWLIFPDGAGHKVLVQVPASLGLTDDQLVRFARGITVTSAAEASAG